MPLVRFKLNGSFGTRSGTTGACPLIFSMCALNEQGLAVSNNHSVQEGVLAGIKTSWDVFGELAAMYAAMRANSLVAVATPIRVNRAVNNYRICSNLLKPCLLPL
jgi:hypothetical protein